MQRFLYPHVPGVKRSRSFRNAFLTISTRFGGTMDSTTSDLSQLSDEENDVSEEQQRYLSYLLRLWQIESKGQLVWRASLEDARTGERCGFASIDALLSFLREQTDVVTDSPKPEKATGG
jgi:hypothetical protein